MATIQDLSALTDPVADHNFGHYCRLTSDDNTSTTEVDTVVADDQVAGILLMLDWEDLEPTKNGYNMNAAIDKFGNTIQDYLDELAANTYNPDAKLMIEIVQRGFIWGGGSNCLNQYPEYLRQYAGRTYPGNAKTVVGVTDNGGDAYVQVTAHGLVTGSVVWFQDLVGPVELNEKAFRVLKITDDYFKLRYKYNVGTVPSSGITLGAASAGTATTTGFVGYRHKGYYNDRLQSLYKRIYAAFGSDPNFGGINTSESAPGTGAEMEDIGTAEDAGQFFIREMKAMRAILPDKSHIFYQNYLNQGTQTPVSGIVMLDLLARECVAERVAICGPDILPTDWNLTGTAYHAVTWPDVPDPADLDVSTNVYHRYRLYEDKLIQGCSVESNSHPKTLYDRDRVPTTYYTMQTLFDWGVNNLNLDFVVWNHWQGAGDWNYIPDDLTVIANNAPPFR